MGTVIYPDRIYGGQLGQFTTMESYAQSLEESSGRNRIVKRGSFYDTDPIGATIHVFLTPGDVKKVFGYED